MSMTGTQILSLINHITTSKIVNPENFIVVIFNAVSYLYFNFKRGESVAEEENIPGRDITRVSDPSSSFRSNEG